MNLQYLKKIGLYVLTAVLSILLIAYVGYHLSISLDSGVETIMANVTTERQTVEVQAFLIRSETVLYAQNAGSIRYLYSDGVHLQSGTDVVGIYRGDDVRDAVSAIESKIEILRNSMEGSQTVADTAVIDEKIAALHLSIRQEIERGNYEFALNNQNELLTLLNRRQVITKTAADFEAQISALQTEREALLAEQDELIESISLPSAGYFYRNVDGYEAEFSSVNVDQMTFSDFYALSDSNMDQPAETGYPVGKVMTDHRWYLICEIEKEQAATMTVGNQYTLAFMHDGSAELTMTLYREVSEPEQSNHLLIFLCDRVPSDFSFSRSQTVEIIRMSYTGYRVPVSAVRIQNGQEGVFVLNGSLVEFREIKPLYEGDGFFILEPRDYSDEAQQNRVGLYDLIIVKGKDLYDGKILS